jgi:hypothetical protein
MKSKIALIALILCVPAALFAADGQPVLSRNRTCQATVPANWTVDATFGMATSPDKKVSLVVSSPKQISSFDELKLTAPTVYKNDKITKQSASEFQMEGTSINDKPNVYRAIPAGGTNFCIVDVDYQSGTVEDARKIAESLKAVK